MTSTFPTINWSYFRFTLAPEVLADTPASDVGERERKRVDSHS